MKTQISTFLTAFLGSSLALGGYYYVAQHSTAQKGVLHQEMERPSVVQTNFSHQGRFTFDENSFVEASDKTVHSVVHVKNLTVAPEVNSIFDLFFNQQMPQSQGRERLSGTGSGVIISPDGYIVTNHHVIEKASSVEVTLNNNKTYKAEIIGTDPASDIALLKVKTEETLPFLAFADSDNTKIGQWVLAVGNPFNLTSTVTAGIISAKARNLSGNYSDKVDSYIQTDAAVNSGNSGGALVNLNGDLIGINTAIASSGTGTFVGYSFAVPSNIAKKVVEDLLEYGNVQKGVLGVQGTALDSEKAKSLKITQTQGFYVDKVEEGSGAEKAGVKQGDIITEIDNIKINSFADLSGHINTKRPSSKVELQLLRDGKLVKKEVVLQKTTTHRIATLGLVVKELSTDEQKKYNIKKGVKIIASNSYYTANGIDLEGKILLFINDNEVTDVEALKRITERLNVRNRNLFILMNEKGEKERYLF